MAPVAQVGIGRLLKSLAAHLPLQGRDPQAPPVRSLLPSVCPALPRGRRRTSAPARPALGDLDLDLDLVRRLGELPGCLRELWLDRDSGRLSLEREPGGKGSMGPSLPLPLRLPDPLPPVPPASAALLLLMTSSLGE